MWSTKENWLGETPLHLCCKLGHWEVAELLVEAKASADTADLRGTTPIETACTNGFDNIVRVLLHAGAARVWEVRLFMSKGGRKGCVRLECELIQ